MKSTLVVGYGSIGQRHAKILLEMGLSVQVFSRRSLPAEQHYPNLETALAKTHPDYVVIANETSEHYSTLKTVLSFEVPQVLVEKPLFSSTETPPDSLKSQVCVAYNLRFHPLLQRLRSEITGQSVLSVQVYVGQYLPDWRPQQDYQSGYSVSRSLGGGVLRDLSHELDYLSWLFGPWMALTACGGHCSSLAGDSDDVFCLLLRMERCPAVVLQMNYLDRSGRREMLVNTDQHTYRLDLVRQEWFCDREAVVSYDVERDQTYHDQHRNLLERQGQSCCSLAEGMEVMQMIESAERAAANKQWVTR